MNAELEDYLLSSEIYIISFMRISKLLTNYFMCYYGDLTNNQEEYNKLKEMFALSKTLQIIAYCMIKHHSETFKKIDKKRNNSFSFDYVMNDGIVI